MSEIQKLTKAILAFNEERDWRQFHNPKDFAISLSLEANEVLEHFQWKTESETKNLSKKEKEEIGAEIADVFYWTLFLSHDLGLDLREVFEKKMRENAKKYSVKKAKGKKEKYNKL